jgi:hypothetical protein
MEQSVGRRSRRTRPVEEMLEEQVQPSPQAEKQHGVHHLPYPNGEGHMIVQNGFPHA